MIAGVHPVLQALLGTLLTWGLTAAGAALVFLLDVEDQRKSQKILDSMLGFAAGVMLAASYWSLLAPAIEIAQQSPLYGPNGRWAFVPAAVGVALGAGAMIAAEKILPLLGADKSPESFMKTVTGQDNEVDDREQQMFCSNNPFQWQQQQQSNNSFLRKRKNSNDGLFIQK